MAIILVTFFLVGTFEVQSKVVLIWGFGTRRDAANNLVNVSRPRSARPYITTHIISSLYLYYLLEGWDLFILKVEVEICTFPKFQNDWSYGSLVTANRGFYASRRTRKFVEI